MQLHVLANVKTVLTVNTLSLAMTQLKFCNLVFCSSLIYLPQLLCIKINMKFS